MAPPQARQRSAWMLAGGLLLAGAAAAQPGPQPATQPPSMRASAPPQPRLDREAQCRALQEAYARSQACYAKFRGVHGVRPEAVQVCGPELLDPGPDCSAARLP